MPTVEQRRVIPSGTRFGSLVVVELTAERYHGCRVYLCDCDCGRQTKRFAGELRDGRTKSCGCLRANRFTTHGMSKDPAYSSWENMRSRCNNPNCPDWRWYGAKGIKVCAGWNNFGNLLADLGPRPEGDYTIDRIDPDSHYSCGHCPECVANGWAANCRWITRSENAKRVRVNRGEGHCRSKLTDDRVREARALRATGMIYREIAALYGVERRTLMAAVKSKTWKHV